MNFMNWMNNHRYALSLCMLLHVIFTYICYCIHDIPCFSAMFPCEHVVFKHLTCGVSLRVTSQL